MSNASKTSGYGVPPQSFEITLRGGLGPGLRIQFGKRKPGLELGADEPCFSGLDSYPIKGIRRTVAGEAIFRGRIDKSRSNFYLQPCLEVVTMDQS